MKLVKIVLAFSLSLSLFAADKPDAFQLYFTKTIATRTKLPYDVKQWVQTFENKDYRAAGHLWSVVSPELPNSVESDIEAAYLYSLWKLQLPQTFVDTLFDFLPKGHFKDSKALVTLEKTIEGSFDSVIDENGVVLKEANLAMLSHAPQRQIYKHLTIWSNLRNSNDAEKYLAALPAGHPWRVPLVEALTLKWARGEKVSAALNLLQREIDSATRHNAMDLLPAYHLRGARIAYQMGNLPLAEELYGQIPRDSRDFLTAQEEILWVWLRRGDTARVRGGLKTLSLEAFDDKFYPELYVIRAISNLKLCYYGEASKDFGRFQKVNTAWARRIDKEIESATPSEPPVNDWYSRLLTRAVASRKAELSKVEALIQHSIVAALPAVGRQAHWIDTKKHLNAEIKHLETSRNQHARIEWRNFATMVRESIRKMRFVRLEVMSQVQQGLKTHADSEETEAQRKKVAEAFSKQQGDEAQTYPFDGVVWPDELFKLRSLAPNQCL